ncbi:MAG: family 43 glycosylhydrolase, partial [Gaiellales bacterium]
MLTVPLLLAVLLPTIVWAPGVRPGITASMDATPGLYTNPLHIHPTASGPFESCADPSIIRGQQPGDPFWYIYCTDNPLNGTDRAASGRLNDHYLPILRSRDLTHWTYVGDALGAPPPWFAGFSGLWAPDIQYFNGRYYLYYTVVGPLRSGRESVIGVATAPTPTGPWTDSGGPVIESQPTPDGGARRWVFDSAVVADDAGRRYIFYGSFVGGISARRLSDDGLHADPAGDVPIASASRYEAVSVVKHGASFYLFASAGECCNGPLSGYGVFVGRSSNILGPYTDREGVPLLGGQVGGTPVLGANGNRWVGPGGNAVFTDESGQDWVLYHAIDRADPYFAGGTATKRPMLLDRLDWADGWPVVNGGLGPSDTPQPAPTARRGAAAAPAIVAPPPDASGPLDRGRMVDFATLLTGPDVPESETPFGAWEWIRPPATDTVELVDGTLRVATQAGDLTDHTASLLSLPTPAGDYIVETRVGLDLPPEGCCQNFV